MYWLLRFIDFLTAKIIYCDKYESCELYKENKCLNVTAPFSVSCKCWDICMLFKVSSLSELTLYNTLIVTVSVYLKDPTPIDNSWE